MPCQLLLHPAREPREQVVALNASRAERRRDVDGLLRAEAVRVACQPLRSAAHEAVVQEATANNPGHAVHDLYESAQSEHKSGRSVAAHGCERALMTGRSAAATSHSSCILQRGGAEHVHRAAAMKAIALSETSAWHQAGRRLESVV